MQLDPAAQFLNFKRGVPNQEPHIGYREGLCQGLWAFCIWQALQKMKQLGGDASWWSLSPLNRAPPSWGPGTDGGTGADGPNHSSQLWKSKRGDTRRWGACSGGCTELEWGQRSRKASGWRFAPTHLLPRSQLCEPGWPSPGPGEL